MNHETGRPRLGMISIGQADQFLTNHYRHHPPPVGALFAVGVVLGEQLVGAAILGHPVPPAPTDRTTIEVTRAGTDGTAGVDVAVYRAAWWVARTRGYRRLITHTQVGEITLGLREVGLRPVATLPPRAGSHTPPRARTDRGVDGVCRVRWELIGGHSEQAQRATRTTSLLRRTRRPNKTPRMADHSKFNRRSWQIWATGLNTMSSSIDEWSTAKPSQRVGNRLWPPTRAMTRGTARSPGRSAA